jgi:hypothetical protein
MVIDQHHTGAKWSLHHRGLELDAVHRPPVAGGDGGSSQAWHRVRVTIGKIECPFLGLRTARAEGLCAIGPEWYTAVLDGRPEPEGSVLAARTARPGSDCWTVDPWQRAAAALRRAFTPALLPGSIDAVKVGSPPLVVGLPPGSHDTLNHVSVALLAVSRSLLQLRTQGMGGYRVWSERQAAKATWQRHPGQFQRSVVMLRFLAIAIRVASSLDADQPGTGAALTVAQLLEIGESDGSSFTVQKRDRNATRKGEPAALHGHPVEWNVLRKPSTADARPSVVVQNDARTIGGLGEGNCLCVNRQRGKCRASSEDVTHEVLLQTV